jgi:hypothetical protein
MRGPVCSPQAAPSPHATGGAPHGRRRLQGRRGSAPRPLPAPFPPGGRARAPWRAHKESPIVYFVVDSTALVGPDAEYCASIGFTDARSFCPVRQEGSPERLACEAWSVGDAKDTGRPGPTWTRNGEYCTGPASGCENHPKNQHQVLDYAGGEYVMCAANGVCGSVTVQRQPSPGAGRRRLRESRGTYGVSSFRAKISLRLVSRRVKMEPSGAWSVHGPRVLERRTPSKE